MSDNFIKALSYFTMHIFIIGGTAAMVWVGLTMLTSPFGLVQMGGAALMILVATIGSGYISYLVSEIRGK